MDLESIVNIDIDFYDKKYILINSKQLDKGTRFISITCYNNGVLFQASFSKHVAYIRYKKADGYSVFNFCEITKDGKILVELTEQMLASSGICQADIVLVKRDQAKIDEETGKIINVDNASVLSTMTFRIDVSETAVDNSEIESTHEFNLLNQTLRGYWDTYEEIVSAAKSYAIGEGGYRDYEKTDNAKYYYEQIGNNHNDVVEAVDRFNEVEESINKTAKEVSDNASTARTVAANLVTYEQTMLERMDEIEIAKSDAQKAATQASSSASAANNSAIDANTSRNEAESFCSQAEAIVNGLNGAFLPMGTITFSELDTLKENGTVGVGYLYNISDNFTTDDSFRNGAGIEYAAGTNVYYTADGYWDCLAGMTVTGVKGDNETVYRKGNINLTAENVGAISNSDIATVDEVTNYLGI